MPKAKAFLLPPPMAWPLTGKRGRTRSPRSPETPEHSAALFLLSLSYPHSSIHAKPTLIRESPPQPLLPPSSEPEEDKETEEDGEIPPDRSSGVRLHECSVCPKRFRTGRALGGHMKCHMERDLRGRIVKRKMRKVSSLGLGLGLGLDLRCCPPSLITQSLSGEEIEGSEDNGTDAVGSLGEQRPTSPASPSLQG